MSILKKRNIIPHKLKKDTKITKAEKIFNNARDSYIKELENKIRDLYVWEMKRKLE